VVPDQRKNSRLGLILTINIIDIGLGNIRSIEHWLEQSNLSSRRVTSPSSFPEGAIVIPGVSSVGEYMRRLKKSGLDKEILERADKGQKIIGICLGFQILTNYSEEDSGVACLGLLDGCAKYIDGNKTHNGWESCEIDSRNASGYANLPKKNKKIVRGRVYFNHELSVTLDSQCYSKTLDNGIVSFAFRDNIFGFQFHPEKSQQTGREILKLVV